VNREQALRFETDYVPRIAQCVVRLLGRGARVEIISYESPDKPTRLSVHAARNEAIEHDHHYPFDLNISLTWDDDEIERLLQPGGEARFLRYLDAIGAKFEAWQGVREVDLVARSQAEPAVLLGGLDFEA
jgi:hypothetical protein